MANYYYFPLLLIFIISNARNILRDDKYCILKFFLLTSSFHQAFFTDDRLTDRKETLPRRSALVSECSHRDCYCSAGSCCNFR